MKRREAVTAIGAGFVALEELTAQHTHGGAKPWVGYRPRAFSAGEYRMLGEFCEMIIPHEEDSPGALDVGVPYFVDVLALYQKPVLGAWRDGLRELESAGFTAMSVAQRVTLLTKLAEAEDRPATPLEQFFAMAKRMTVDAWALSEDGMRQGLGYKGNAAVTEFPGCR